MLYLRLATLAFVWKKKQIANAMYFDYCKSYLWPTFHYLGLSDNQSKERQDKAWNAYYQANLAYANKVAEFYREGDLVRWVLLLTIINLWS